MNISKVIVWMRPDGGLSVCLPCISQDDPEGFTEAQALNRALQKDVPPDAINPQVLDRSQLPTDGYFRNAWELKSGKVEVAKPKARAIHMEQIRRARVKELEKLDRDWMRASGQKRSTEADAIETKRQKLRDIPQTANLGRFESLDELKSFWPDDLPRVED